MSYDFSRLTPTQQRVLTYQGWQIGDAMTQPSPATCRKLIERGLLIPRDVKDRSMTVREYEVPIPVHMAWCEYCEQKELAAAAANRAAAQPVAEGG